MAITDESGNEDESNVAIYDLRRKTRLDAGLAIGTTFFMCIVLAAGALIFSNITSVLVI